MIRVACEKDIESIYKLGSVLNDNFSKTYNLIDYINDNNYIILVNEEFGINAMLIVYKNIDYYELETIVVDSKDRNKGIGTQLLEYFINNYTKKDEIILLEVATNNMAIMLYKKFNFEIINTRKKYYGNIDAYIMKKVV